MNILYIYMIFFGDVNNISLEGTMSQISYLGPSFWSTNQNNGHKGYTLDLWLGGSGGGGPGGSRPPNFIKRGKKRCAHARENATL